MNTEQNTAGMVAVVRAIPAPGHKHRWCGKERWVPNPEKRPQQEMEELPRGGFKPVFDAAGKPVWAKHALPWPDTQIKVNIVDNPAPFDPEANGGAPVEISPTTLAMLKADPRINVQVLGSDGGDPADVAMFKATVVDLEQKLDKAHRHIASLQEQVNAASEAAAAKVAGQVAKLREDLAEAHRKLAERKK